MTDYILYILAIMIFWDLSIHVIDKFKMGIWFKNSKSKLSYYYPHFWGKPPFVSEECGRMRYDYFWISYWGIALTLLITYIILK